MRKIFLLCFAWMLCIQAFGQSVRDTVIVYETITVYDTLVIHDTIRINKALNEYIAAPLENSALNFEAPATPAPAANLQNDIILNESKKKHKSREAIRIRKMYDLSAMILAAQTMVGISQQEQKYENDLEKFPAQMSIIYPMSTHGQKSKDYHYAFSFNLFSGRVGAVTGLEFGTLFNKVERDIKGVQFSGLFNTAHGASGIQFAGLGSATREMKGMQVSGIGNITHQAYGIQFSDIINISDKMQGVQVTGITNITREVSGIQFAGILNMTESAKGIQISGITNLVSENSRGLQFAAITNVTGQSQGLQVAGIANVNGGASGAQIALFNQAKVLRGFQVGLINITDTIERGVSLALINIVKRGGYRELELSFADYANVSLNYKSGMRYFYTIVSVGGNFVEDPLWILGLGVGNRTSLTKKIDLQSELIAYAYMPQDFKKKSGVEFNTSVSRLKVGIIYNINSKIGISLAPSIYHYSLSEEQDQDVKFSAIKPFYTHDFSDGRKTAFGLGLSLGVLLQL